MTFRRRKLVRPRLLRIAALAALSATLACGSAALDAPPERLDPTDPNDALETAPVAIELAPLTVHTYDGSGQFIHPDAYVFPSAWHGRRYWFTATPYPAGNSTYENPSLYWATGAGAWTAPPGVRNPLARADGNSFLSDPELQHDPVADELRLYYRKSSTQRDELWLVTSGDGQRWSDARLLMTSRRYSLISPAIVREETGGWRMWTVDPGIDGCRAKPGSVALSARRSADGLTWGTAEPVSLDIPGYSPWHWDVQYIPARHEYWALVAAYPEAFNCSYTSVFFGRSTDGVTWRMSPSPLLTTGSIESVRSVVYRSTFHYHPNSDAVTVWYSGARLEVGGYVFGGATARYAVSDLLRRVERSFDVHTGVRRASIESAVTGDSIARAAFMSAFP
ncbi:MAG: hypothetical protein JWN79_352 [Gemmatimonadetes bacterium]|nr:hypothetical protein [Gemmatimonadota bacterium]